MQKLLNFFTLFTSTGTLICCALPALVVGLGFGAAMAGFLSEYPQFIWISTHKVWLFLMGAILLTLGGVMQFKTKDLACPIDSKGEACKDTRQSSRVIYFVSVAIYLIGFSFAYIAPIFL